MKIKIKEFAKVINGATPSTKRPEYYGGDIVWITPNDLATQKTKYIYSGEKSITEMGFNSCSAQMIPAGNLLMSSRAPVGLLSINKTDCCTNQGFKSFVVDKAKCNVEYLYYYLKYHIKEVEALGSGTTFKEVSKLSIENYEIYLPELKVQQEIVDKLSPIDEKIINNEKIISELKKTIKTIYGYWFLQYDFPDENNLPYRASGGKMRFNSKVGIMIPENWKVIKLKDLIVENEKSNIQVGEAIDGTGRIPFFTSGNDIKYIDEHLVDGFNLFLATGGNSNIKNHFGKASYSTDTWSVNFGKYTTIVYLYFKTIEAQFDTLFFHGTGLKHLQKPLLLKQHLAVPNPELLDKFNRRVLEQFEKKSALFIENKKLEELREFLTSFLMKKTH